VLDHFRFVLNLLAEERLLDELLVEQGANAAASASADGGGDGGDLSVQMGLELVHDVYGTCVHLFGEK
jgi:hypothetical protein